MKIQAIVKEPGRKARNVAISTTLHHLQLTVGGYIETVTLRDGYVVICDEEGRYKDYEHNCCIDGIEFVGTIVIVRHNDDGDLTPCGLTLCQAINRFPGLLEE